MQKPLTIDEIKNIAPGARGAWVVIEQAYDSVPVKVKLTERTDYIVAFGRVVRAYSSYNQKGTGWRLWANMPTQQERKAAKWKTGPN